jgi:DNA-binding NarL/FixJ family response regulator
MNRDDEHRRQPLTPREIEVLQRLMAGSNIPEVAEQLFLGTDTVHIHTQNILEKLGVTSRLEAVAYAINHPEILNPGKGAGGPSG